MLYDSRKGIREHASMTLAAETFMLPVSANLELLRDAYIYIACQELQGTCDSSCYAHVLCPSMVSPMPITVS